MKICPREEILGFYYIQYSPCAIMYTGAIIGAQIDFPKPVSMRQIKWAQAHFYETKLLKAQAHFYEIKFLKAKSHEIKIVGFFLKESNKKGNGDVKKIGKLRSKSR